MDSLGQADVILLVVMLANVLYIACDRFCCFTESRRKSRNFVRNVAAAFHDGDLAEVIAIAGRTKWSPVANIIGSGLMAFASAPEHVTHQEAIERAQRAFQRARRMLVAHLSWGLGTLRTIAGTAPFVGLLGTVYGILDGFRGIGMSKAAGLGMVASNLAQALITTALGLVVAVPAVWFYNHFRLRVEAFESEMSNAELEVITYLNWHLEWRGQAAKSAVPADFSSLGSELTTARSWEVPYDHQRAIFVGVGLCALYLAYMFGLAVYWHFAASY
jgi:biopolymer transport protein ExbB/TolQ